MNPDEHGLNPRQRQFVELFTGGMNAGLAYVAAGYSPKGADVAACKLLRIAKVAVAVAAERARMRKASQISKDDALDWLAGVVRTPVGEVDAASVYAQEVQVSEFGTKIKMAGKMEAIEKLAKMLGWYEPEKVEHTVEVVIGGNGNGNGND
jgi:hypothetical protein